MARTYAYSDILNLVQRSVPHMTNSDLAPFLCNAATNYIWEAYDWRESLTNFPPFYLIPGAQDHGTPAVVIPSDFLGLRQANLVRLNSTPSYRQDIPILKDLKLTNIYGLPANLGYVPESSAFRVFPRVPINIGVPDWLIEGVYKRRPTKVTADVVHSTLLPFDDMYFMNMVEVFKYVGWQLGGDPRAGGIQSTNRGKQFVGQYAIAREAVESMAENEGLELGDIAIAPKDPLAITYMNGGFSSPINRLF